MQLLKRLALAIPQIRVLHDDRQRLAGELSRALEDRVRLREELAAASIGARGAFACEVLRRQDLFIVGDIVVEAPCPPVSQAVRSALERDGYETVELYLIRHLVHPGDTVLDLGSGLGLTAIAAAKAAGPGRVVGYEADPEIAALASRNASRNGAVVEIRNAAISSTAGWLTLHRTPDFLANSLYATPQSTPVSVESDALRDVLIEVRPTVVASDVEGVEEQIFADADLSSVDRLMVETHPQLIGSEGVERCTALLAGHGLRRVEPLCWGPVLVFDRNDRAAGIRPFVF